MQTNPTHDDAPARRPKRRRVVVRTILGVVVGLLGVVALLIAVLLVDANVLRKPIANIVSRTLDRPFAINGDLRIRLSPHPHVEVNDVVLGNAAWGSREEMVRLERGVVGIKLLPLLHRQVVLPEVELTHPDILLERDVDGEANWVFGRQDTQSDKPSHPPEIHSLWIRDGKLAFADPTTQTDIELTMNSDRSPGDQEAMLSFAGNGSLRNEAFKLEGRAASLLELKEAGKPYKLEVKVAAGATHASFDGTLVPLKLESIDGVLALSGDDLSKLYPIVPVPLPWTPAYKVGGHFVRDANKYTLRDLKGRVGSSDVNGEFGVDIGGKKPAIVANVTSKRLDYKDLAGFLGSPPPQKGKPRPAEQVKEAQKLEQTGKVFSEKPYSLERLRTVDADVRFKGERIIARDIPLDDIKVSLKLKDGKLALNPLDFGVAGGNITSRIDMDASRDVILTSLDATVKNLEVKQLMPKVKQGQGSAGKVGGRAKLATKGNSVAQMAASANGELALIMSQGRASTLALVLTNLDLANATKYLLRGDPNAPVYCAVIHANLKNGDMEPDLFVVDSSEEKITAEGGVDLSDEEYKLRLVAHSKRPSLVALRGPIRIGGTFKHPQIRPEAGPLAVRVGAAVALGTLLTPVASLLALVDPGGAKDSNCASLMTQAREDVAKSRVDAPKAPAPAHQSATDKESPAASRRGTQ